MTEPSPPAAAGSPAFPTAAQAAAEAAATPPPPRDGTRVGEGAERCVFPGCVHPRAPYQGRGPRPRYCGQEVDGVLHDRHTYFRAAATGRRQPGAGQRGPGEQPERSPRPVSLARASVPVLVAELGELLTGHTAAQAALIGRFEATIADLASGDALAVEVAAVQRDARAEIEAAEITAEDADGRARTATADAEQARATAREAVTAAEDAEDRAARADATATEARAGAAAADERAAAALRRVEELTAALQTRTGERDTAREERDTAAAARDELTGRLDDARATAARQADELTTARAEVDRLTGAHDELAAQLATARGDRDAERRRADTATQAVDRADAAAAAAREALETERADHRAEIERITLAAREQRAQDQATHRGEVDRLTTELQAAHTAADTARGAVERARAEHAATREAAAEQRGELAAARRALTDERDRHTAALAELRDRHAAELAELRTQHAAEPAALRPPRRPTDPAASRPGGVRTGHGPGGVHLMARLLRCAFTERPVVDRVTTVTRRRGWTFLTPGDRLALCRTVRGRRPGEPLAGGYRTPPGLRRPRPHRDLRRRPETTAAPSATGPARDLIVLADDEPDAPPQAMRIAAVASWTGIDVPSPRARRTRHRRGHRPRRPRGAPRMNPTPDPAPRR